MRRDELVQALDALLDPAKMPDHGPNGLQVEGRDEVRRVLTAVTASQRVIEAAVERGADALLVHHGILWHRETAAPITGWYGRRVRTLLANDVSLIAYHLPLDAHPTLGNNAMLLAALGLKPDQRFGTADLGMTGRFDRPRSPDEVLTALGQALGTVPTLLEGDGEVRTVGVVTGAGQRYFEDAIAAGCDLFVTGEASEFVTHLARETGVHYAWAGHHATEKGGIRALGDHLRKTHGLDVSFFDEPNPV